LNMIRFGRCGEEDISFPCIESNPGFPAVQLVR
jgi:hypothetical protein